MENASGSGDAARAARAPARPPAPRRRLQCPRAAEQSVFPCCFSPRCLLCARRWGGERRRAGHRAPGAPPSGAAPAIMRRRALVALLHAAALAFAFAARVAEGGTWTWADAVAAEREAGAVVDEQVAQERVATRVGVSAGVEGIKDAASAAVTAGGGAANEVRLKASKREGATWSPPRKCMGPLLGLCIRLAEYMWHCD